jgi:hypothetical protein
MSEDFHTKINISRKRIYSNNMRKRRFYHDDVHYKDIRTLADRYH